MFDVVLFLVLILVAFLAGVITTLVVGWRLFNFMIERQPASVLSSQPSVSNYELPKIILDQIGSGKEPAGALNAMLQFLFQECRNTKRVRRWFRQRLSLELEELLTRTTTGKLFEKIVLRDLNLGNHLPAIRSIEVKTLDVDSGTKLINDVELCLDLEYSGGFQLVIDASMRLSKSAQVSVTVSELSGPARLKFSRHPYTHWNFSFYSDPNLQLIVESQFQGRSLPQINSIIASQIRKALKRKHTLPFFKIRYKPFFVKAVLDSLPEGETLEPPSGTLELTIIEASRLGEHDGYVFCSVAIDNTAWIEMTQSGSANYLTVDVTIKKSPDQPLGISFKQEFVPDKYQVCCVVDSITNPSISDLKVGDIVVFVNGKNVQSLNSLDKLIRHSPKSFVLRVERRMKYLAGTEAKSQEFIEGFGLRNRGIGTGEKTDSDSSNPPSASDSPAKQSISGSPDRSKGPSRWSLSTEPEIEISYPQMFSTKELPCSKLIQFNETFRIEVHPEHRYLNLSLWKRGLEKNILLGHLSLPVAKYCCPPTVGHYISTFALLPPNPSIANSLSNELSNHPGFEPCLCFGDVLLSFAFTPSSPGGPVQSSTSKESTSSSAAAPVLGSVASSAHPPPPPVTIVSAPSATDAPPSLEHDFVRTHFEKVTQCGFCFKKIWLKDALQCQGCTMSCHKKCAIKAQAGAGCARKSRRPSVQPEIVTPSTEESLTQGRTLGNLIANVANRSLRRAGSATNLVPPGMDGSSSTSSVSLPPTPNHSPSPSRKTSLAEEALFTLSASNDDDISQALEMLLSRPHDEQVMDAAKASGKMLFADFPPDARKRKIDAMICKLKDEIDAESLNHHALQKEEQAAENADAKAKVAFLAGKSEERLQALAVLMLHCCAGLQDYQESNNMLTLTTFDR
ncbi:PDZ [Nesidiocoris tenuis]|uniref:PDZ n=1 Tax=Nesidiocoris tenuis TaxID=355587 RepID=A0ABN7AL63_9HEMI|nr:PDZ [Nesidiocoris tenuis]